MGQFDGGDNPRGKGAALTAFAYPPIPLGFRPRARLLCKLRSFALRNVRPRFPEPLTPCGSNIIEVERQTERGEIRKGSARGNLKRGERISERQ